MSEVPLFNKDYLFSAAGVARACRALGAGLGTGGALCLLLWWSALAGERVLCVGGSGLGGRRATKTGGVGSLPGGRRSSPRRARRGRGRRACRGCRARCRTCTYPAFRVVVSAGCWYQPGADKSQHISAMSAKILMNALPGPLSDKMYLSFSFRKSTPPQNRQLIILIGNSKQQVGNFVGESTLQN